MDQTEQKRSRHLGFNLKSHSHKASESDAFRLKGRPRNPLQAGSIRCIGCSSHTFARSRFRSEDIFRFLMLQYPVRCTNCNHRQYVIFAVAAAAGRTRKPVKQFGTKGAWKTWTEGHAPEQRPPSSEE